MVIPDKVFTTYWIVQKQIQNILL